MLPVVEGREFSPRDVESNEEAADMLSAKRRCCFYIPCLDSYKRSSSSSSSTSPLTGGSSWWRRGVEDEGGLWARGINALKKIREWSEIVAGPRWKTFIRRFNRNKSGGGSGSRAKFQYDSVSYALNFDEGSGHNGNSDEEDDFRFRNFSSRYASMDLGKDGPTFS